MIEDGRAFAEQMLPKVSRTFALCIRLLPGSLEYSVLVAYLLCRIADTIEDTHDLAPSKKAELLRDFANCVRDTNATASTLNEEFRARRSDEEVLAAEADVVLAQYRHLPASHRDAIAPWVEEMCKGMAEFAGKEDPGARLHELASVSELERYCYFVAGTVGHLLTGLFRLDYPRMPEQQHRQLQKLATSFGLGLQLTNIIKDVADDRSRGWTFVPRELCQLAGIQPGQLHDPNHAVAARTVLDMLIARAQQHLDDALDYCTTLPRSQYRVRIFCLTSLLFAVRTLRLARNDERLLDPTHKVKISRNQVYETVAMTALIAPSNRLVRGYYHRLQGASR